MRSREIIIEKLEECIQNNNVSEAVELANKMISEHPKDVLCALKFTDICVPLKDYDTAIKHLSSVYKTASKDIDIALLSTYLQKCFFYKNNYDYSNYWLNKALFHLISLLRGNELPSHVAINHEDKVAFNDLDYEKEAFSLLETIAEQDISCSFGYGSLLGIEREGQFLAHDKDIDLICFLEQLDKLEEFLLTHGFSRITDFNHDNFKSFVHNFKGFTVDLMGLARNYEKKEITGGMWSYNRHPRWSYYQDLPWFELKKITKNNFEIFYPTNVEKLLSTKYGSDWVTSNPNWAVFAEEPTMKSSALHLYYVKYNLVKRWLEGDLNKIKSYGVKAYERYPEDFLFAEAFDLLSRA